MTGMKDQLGDTLFTYPNQPGFKSTGTSQDAARATRGKAATLREKVYDEIALAGAKGLTADQVAARLGADWRSIRPRLSELGKLGRIVPTGERRANDTKLKAAVWRVI